MNKLFLVIFSLLPYNVYSMEKSYYVQLIPTFNGHTYFNGPIISHREAQLIQTFQKAEEDAPQNTLVKSIYLPDCGLDTAQKLAFYLIKKQSLEVLQHDDPELQEIYVNVKNDYKTPAADPHSPDIALQIEHYHFKKNIAQENNKTDNTQLAQRPFDDFPTPLLIRLLNVGNCIDCFPLQEDIIEQLCDKSVFTKPRFFYHLQKLSLDIQNVILSKILIKQNFHLPIINMHLQTLAPSHTFTIQQPSKTFFSETNPYNIFVPCYFNTQTTTTILTKESSASYLSNENIIIQKNSKNPVVIPIDQLHLKNITNIIANAAETLFYCQAIRIDGDRNLTNFIVSTERKKIIKEISPNDLCCLIKNNPGHYYSLESGCILRHDINDNSTETVITLDRDCTTEHIFTETLPVKIADNTFEDQKTHRLTSITCNAMGDVIALCTENQIFIIAHENNQWVFKKIETPEIIKNIGQETTTQYKTREKSCWNAMLHHICSAHLNHIGNQLLITTANHSLSSLCPAYYHSSWLIDLNTNTVQKITTAEIRKTSNYPICNVQFANNDRFIIFSNAQNCYQCYDTHTKISFIKQGLHTLTANATGQIIRKDHYSTTAFHTQEIITPKLTALLNTFSELNLDVNNSVAHKLRLYQSLSTNPSDGKIDINIDDITGKPKPFFLWNIIKQHPYLSGLSFMALISLLYCKYLK